jgi:circadian clock protein KaiC
LEGLFIRLGHAIDTIGAKRVVLDTIESLFGGLSNEAILRAELRRLFRWLKDKGVTAIITAERGESALTRQGLEEYVSDCVILLDHRVTNQISTRRIRVVKYRGTAHGTNEYPFLIDQNGFSVLPITSLGLEHKASNERISTGVKGLDAMLGGKGYFRGSSVLISGTAGTGKTSLAAHFADAACGRGERCLYLSFEESEGQLIRNMRSVGLNLQPWVNKGLLCFRNTRSTHFGLEMHLATILRMVRDFEPEVMIVDPMDSLVQAGDPSDATLTLTRIMDFLKARGITGLFTNLTTGGEITGVNVSSLMDTWILLRDLESGGERNRVLYVLKSRGMEHSNQAREFLLTNDGVELIEAYSGPDGVLTGSMRLSQAAREKAERLAHEQELEARRRELARKQEALEARIEAMRKEFEAEAEEARHIIHQQMQRAEVLREDQKSMARRRGAAAAYPKNNGRQEYSKGTTPRERKPERVHK